MEWNTAQILEFKKRTQTQKKQIEKLFQGVNRKKKSKILYEQLASKVSYAILSKKR